MAGDEDSVHGAGMEASWLGYEATSRTGHPEGGGVTGEEGRHAGVGTSTRVNKCQSTIVLLG